MRIWTGGLAAATAMTCLALTPAAVHAAPFPSGGPRDASPVWGACPPESGPPVSGPPESGRHPRQQCATIRVPMDYRNLRGRHITVVISRIPAADPARRLGTLVFLPGGPGIGGLDWPTDYYGPDQPSELRDRYDLVGFDARGVRHSTPVTCGLAPDDIGPRYAAPDGSIDAMVAYSRRAAAACLRHGGTLIRHITTANTARDLDRIRAALGERRISLYGLSYGTYLGATYASMFPHRTDRVVLDSAIDPRRAWYAFMRLGGQGLADRLPDLTAWIAARHETYSLGRTPAQVHERYRTLTATLDAAPVDVDGRRYDATFLRDVTLHALREPGDSVFPDAAAWWWYLAQRTGGPQSTRPAHRPATAPPTDNRLAVQYAVQCGDVAWPRDVRTYRAAVLADRQRFPDDAGRSANIRPCAFWPAPLHSPSRVDDRGPRNILVVQNMRDPATPIAAGVGMVRALGRRAALVTADFGGHGAVGPQECATAVALTYLVADHRHLPDTQTCPAGA